ncbi:hypothetical protein GQ54DRAFT_309024 [Martensiomyces pterosporus]|nr:hypothetical protein GQ54DRAFT_309024 [Martensiomyces pterosporus]
MEPREHSLSDRVTLAATFHYNEETKRCNWTAISKELKVPVLDCLRHLDSKWFAHRALHRPNKEDWLWKDVMLLRKCIKKYFGVVNDDDWPLVGRFMNVYPLDCMRMGKQRKMEFKMTKELYLEISRLRMSGLLWPTIHGQVPADVSLGVLRSSYETYRVSRMRYIKCQIKCPAHRDLRNHRVFGEREEIQELEDDYSSCSLCKRNGKRLGRRIKELTDARHARKEVNSV